MNTTAHLKCFLVFMLFGLCLSPHDVCAEKRVTAKGMSFYEEGREMIAREKALDQAKRAAVEQAVGTLIESKTAVKNRQLVREEILTRSSGYLKNIKIVNEHKTDFGTYEVVIEADVAFAAMSNDMDRFQKLIRWQKNPQCAITIEPGLDKRHLPTAQKAANLLAGKLKASGLKVFKYSQSHQLQMGYLVDLSLDISSRKTQYQDMEITLNEVSLNTSVYQPGRDEILATSGAVKSLPGENRLKALDKGVVSCVDTIWKDLRKQLITLWEKELYNERDIALMVNNVPSLTRAQEILSIFESDVSGVASARLVDFAQNRANYSLLYRGWPEHLLNEIEMSYFKNKYFESHLQSLKGNALTINLK